MAKNDHPNIIAASVVIQDSLEDQPDRRSFRCGIIKTWQPLIVATVQTSLGLWDDSAELL